MTATQLEHAKTSNDVIIHGTCDQRFHQLHDFFARNLSTGEDTGAELGGSNGHGNARSVALVQSVLSCGGEVGGVRLLSRAGCERVLEVQSDGPDRIVGFDTRWGMGLALENATIVEIYGPRVAGRRIACWGGSGGSFVMNDLDARMTVAYVMNLHKEHGGLDARGIGVVRAAYEGLFEGNHI